MRSSIDLFSESFHYFKERAGLFFEIYIGPALLLLALEFFIQSSAAESIQSSDAEGIAISIIIGLIGVVISLIYGVAFIYVTIHPEATSLKESYAFAFKYWTSYLWASIIAAVVFMGLMIPIVLISVFSGYQLTTSPSVGLLAATLLGIIILVIALMAFMTRFSFYPFTLFVDQKRGWNTLAASALYVKGHLLAVIVRLAFISLIFFIPFVVLLSLMGMFVPSEDPLVLSTFTSVATFFIAPLWTIYLYKLFMELKRIAKPAEMATANPVPEPTPATAPQV